MNKKRLSKLLIPMLAVSGINANAMENVNPIKRSKSFSKKRSSMRGVILQEDKAKRNENRAYVVQYSGSALNAFLQDFEFAAESLHPTGRIFGGNAGTVTKCRRKKDGKILAVKCEPNAESTGLTTVDNATVHATDNGNETQFYNDLKKWWPDKKWTVRCHAKYNDGFVSYTVTDWIQGETLGKWISKLPFTREGLMKLAEMLKQYNLIINDLSEHDKINSGMHQDNLMVVEDNDNPQGFQLKVVDNGRYRDRREGENLEIRNARQIIHLLNLPRLADFWDKLKYEDIFWQYSTTLSDGWLMLPRKQTKHLHLAYQAFERALECINARWISAWPSMFSTGSKDYSNVKRNMLPSQILEMAKFMA